MQRQIVLHSCKVKEKEAKVQIGEIIANYSPDKGLIARIYVELNKLQNNKRTKRLPSTNGQGDKQTLQMMQHP